jgi:hypothetical protein
MGMHLFRQAERESVSVSIPLSGGLAGPVGSGTCVNKSTSRRRRSRRGSEKPLLRFLPFSRPGRGSHSRRVGRKQAASMVSGVKSPVKAGPCRPARASLRKVCSLYRRRCKQPGLRIKTSYEHFCRHSHRPNGQCGRHNCTCLMLLQWNSKVQVSGNRWPRWSCRALVKLGVLGVKNLIRTYATLSGVRKQRFEFINRGLREDPKPYKLTSKRYSSSQGYEGPKMLQSAFRTPVVLKHGSDSLNRSIRFNCFSRWADSQLIRLLEGPPGWVQASTWKEFRVSGNQGVTAKGVQKVRVRHNPPSLCRYPFLKVPVGSRDVHILMSLAELNDLGFACQSLTRSFAL